MMFTDVDEDGDRITVRGNEELQAMVNGVGYNCLLVYFLFKSLTKTALVIQPLDWLAGRPLANPLQ